MYLTSTVNHLGLRLPPPYGPEAPAYGMSPSSVEFDDGESVRIRLETESCHGGAYISLTVHEARWLQEALFLALPAPARQATADAMAALTSVDV